jgi:hypothetical protein
MQLLGGLAVTSRAFWCVSHSAPVVDWRVLMVITGFCTIVANECVTKAVWPFTLTDKMYAVIVASIGMWFRC